MSATAASGRRDRRWTVRLGLLGLGLGLLGIGAAVASLWWGRESTPPGPPGIALAGVDPAVAAAVTAVRDRVVREPKSANAWGTLGAILLANEFPADADPCLARAEELDPHEPRWPYLRAWGLLPRDREAAVQHLRRALERSGDDEKGIAIRLRLAETLLTVGSNEEAGALFQQVLDKDPQNIRAHYGAGMVASALDKTDAAVMHLSGCTESPFARRKACAELAALSLRRGEPKAAEEFSRKADRAAKDVDWPDPYLSENARLAIGEQNRLGQGEQLQGAGRLKEAAAQFRDLIKDYPNDGRAYVKLGMALDQMGDYAEAEPVLRTAIHLAPDESQAHYFLSVALFHQAEGLGKPASPHALELVQEAADQARIATDLKPDHAFAHLYLGLCLKELGKKDAAIASLRKAVLYSPDTTDPHLHLGEALAENGNKKEGLAELKRAAELAGEEDSRPREALKRWSNAS
jgi:tetratricopeptide (TPR) repeat protein